EEAALFVVDGLAANDWRRVRNHDGRASFKGYLASLTWRLLEDFSRSRFGRKRPPAWVKRLGGLWTLLFQLLCLERFSLGEAVELAASRKGRDSAPEAERVGRELLEKIVDCGAEQNMENEFDEERYGSPGSQDFTDGVEQKDRDNFIRALFGRAFGGEINDVMGHDFQLTGEERLLLKLCFQDELSVTAAGKMLGLNRFQAHGRMKRLLARLRRDIERLGVDDELLTLLS
ncbi:MAG: hypothetical protein ABFS19_13335, partial [Thermodesulfobacteriota bacterium]